MKTKLLSVFLGAIALCASGCVSHISTDYASFIAKVPAATITDISTVTQSPIWGFQASASGISTNPQTGVMTVTNGKAVFTIPLWGFSKTFSVSGLQFQASPEQLAAAAALQKATADAAAATQPVPK